MTEQSFDFVSKRAEGWLHTVFMVAQHAEQGRVKAAYQLLDFLGDDYEEHAATLSKSLPEVIPFSDGPIHWPENRGYSAVLQGGTVSCWSSAHEAADGIARIAIFLLLDPVLDITDPVEQEAASEHYLANRLKAISIPRTEVAALQERIRRERIKLLRTKGGSDFSEVSTKSKKKRKPGPDPVEGAERDAKVMQEYHAGMKEGRWKNQAEFARRKGKSEAWFSAVKRRVERRPKPDELKKSPRD